MNRLELLKDLSQEREMLEECLRKKASESPPPLRILEAGCGRRWPLRLKDVPYTLTGIDIDEDALAIRKLVHNDLHEVVVGDLRTARFNNGAFDVVFSSFVLEHIRDADRVLENFVRWLRPGGLLILKIPDRDSVYGFVTRMTPHWFHVLFARHITGWKQAGKPGYGPYPTVHDRVVSRRGIHAFAAKHGLAIREEYGQAIALRDAKPLGALLVNSVVGALGAVSLGRLASDHSNLTYVLEKRPVREEAAVTYFILASLAALTLGLLAILGVRKALWTIWPLCALLLPSNLAFTPPGGIRVSPQLIPLLLLPALLSSASREAGRRGLRWCLADTLMLLMFVCQNISNINNNKYYNLTTLWLFLAWVAPYILGRLYLSSEQDLAWALRPLCVCLAALCLFMVVESLTGLNPLKMATRVGYPEGRSATRAEGYVRALHARDT